MTNHPDNITASTSAAINSEQAAQKLFSQELFRSGNTVCIEHQGEHYWLRLTRGNKLILTK
jgi:hemin uptake protein HemP